MFTIFIIIIIIIMSLDFKERCIFVTYFIIL